MEAGWISAFDMPDGYAYGSEASVSSPFETWLDASPHFEPVSILIADAQAGDLILSRPHRMPWHLAIFLGGELFAHVDIRQGAQVTGSFPVTWIRRVVRVYRPISL
jgi:cell wall-associated NlpC family hydrolase